MLPFDMKDSGCDESERGQSPRAGPKVGRVRGEGGKFERWCGTVRG